MATESAAFASGVARQERAARPLGGVGFDWVMALIFSWPLIGAYSDAWAHNHLPIDDFFTPWHGILYSGFLAAAITMFVVPVINMRRGLSWRQALPEGYGLSFVGVLVIFVGGPGDLLWHTVFGFEKDMDAAFSPTHLLIALAIGLVVSGPLRAAWHRDNGRAPGFSTLLPGLISLAFLLSTITLITQFSHPFFYTWAAMGDQTVSSNTARMIGALDILFQTSILMGVLLVALRRWALPFGALTLVFTLNAVALCFMHDRYYLIPGAVLTGLVADVLVRYLQPSAANTLALRLFAFMVPVTSQLLYFGALMLHDGVWWSVHMWLGVTAWSGVAGLLLSFVALPPAIPASASPSSPSKSA
ncbi:MAG TPA: hypothetical protein VF510_19475 [Ktedonobacterales bacterium]